jgi:hypothetical protein
VAQTHYQGAPPQNSGRSTGRQPPWSSASSVGKMVIIFWTAVCQLIQIEWLLASAKPEKTGRKHRKTDKGYRQPGPPGNPTSQQGPCKFSWWLKWAGGSTRFY